MFSCKEIEKWYQKNFSKILSNEFVTNHDVHKDNIPLLKSIIAELENNQEEYRHEFETVALPKQSGIITDTMLPNLLDRFHQVAV